MTAAMITQRGTILARHSVREDFSECSTRNGSVHYYISKGSAIHSYEDVLEAYGLCFDPDMLDMPGDEGRITIDIYIDENVCVGMALIMWYRMPSGRYEFTGYIT